MNTGSGEAASSTSASSENRKLTRDHIWVWDGRANSLGPSIYGLGDATRFFHSDNIMCMWLMSTTPDTVILDRIRDCKKVVWDLTITRWVRKAYTFSGEDARDKAEHIGWLEEDSWSAGDKAASKEEARKISKLSKNYPNLAGGILDYSFSGFAHRGGTPEELKTIYEALKSENKSLQLYWMIYNKDLDPKWSEYLPYLDVLSLWEQNPQELKNLDATIDKCANAFPGKPILLGLFLANYWAKKLEPGEEHQWKWHSLYALEPLPKDILELQFTKAVQLVKEGKIIGFQILAEALLDKFPETVNWVRDFLGKSLSS